MNLSGLNQIVTWNKAVREFIQDGQCSSPDFWKPYHFVMLALQLQRHGVGVDLPEDVKKYASRMHLWEAIGQPPPVLVNERDATGRFQPLEALKSDRDVARIANLLAELFRGSCQNGTTAESVSSLAAELLGNCYSHSECQNGIYGLVCAQAWPNGKKAQIAIADSGIGIRKSLLASGLYDGDLAEANACEFATRYQITSKPGKGHAGYGLTLALGLIEHNYGGLHILSGNEYFYSAAGCSSSGVLDVPFEGTLLVFEWDTARGLDSRAVYESWPLPEGVEDDDFDF